MNRPISWDVLKMKPQQDLFPVLHSSVGPLSKELELVTAVMALVPLDRLLLARRASTGRPPKDRAAMATAYIAKAILNLPSTRAKVSDYSVPNPRRRNRPESCFGGPSGPPPLRSTRTESASLPRRPSFAHTGRPDVRLLMPPTSRRNAQIIKVTAANVHLTGKNLTMGKLAEFRSVVVKVRFPTVLPGEPNHKAGATPINQEFVIEP